MKKLILLLVTSMLLISFLPSVESIKIQQYPDYKEVNVGETFTVDLNLANVNDTFDTVAINLLTYNPDVLELKKVEKGDLFDFWLVWIEGEIDNSKGQLRSVCGASNESSNTNGTFVTLTFKALTDGMAYVTVQHLGVARAGDALPIECPCDFNSCEVKVGTGVYDDDNGGSGGGGGGGYIPPDPEPDDSDGDGVPDDEDKCNNFDDNIDTDGDGIPDGCDPTPDGEPENERPNIINDSGDITVEVNKSALLWAEVTDDSSVENVQIAIQSTDFENMTLHMGKWKYSFSGSSKVQNLSYIIKAFDDDGDTTSISRSITIIEEQIDDNDNDDDTNGDDTNDTDTPDDNTTSDNTTTPKPKENDDNWVYVFSAIFIVAVVAVAIFWYYRHKIFDFEDSENVDDIFEDEEE